MDNSKPKCGIEMYRRQFYLKEKYKKYLLDKFGVESIHDVEFVIKHEYLSKFMDVTGYKSYIIGLNGKIDIDKVKSEVHAMERYYYNHSQVIEDNG